MRATILAATLACTSVPVFAHQCNVELHGNMSLENNVLTVQLDNNSQMRIDQNKTLFIDNQAMALSATQQGWVNDYYDGINQAAPQAANIATEAVALASTAVNEVFTELLGSNSNALADLSEKLQSLDRKIQYNFYAENGDIRLSSESFENDQFFGQEWEGQFEQAIEEVVTDSIGHLMVAIGTQMIFSGGDMDEFEQKMQRFGEQIEDKIEYQASALEDKAEQLCATLQKVDYAEQQLQQITQLARLDVIEIKDQSNRM